MLNQKQFIYPYRFEERHPCIHDRVFFIPSYYFEHENFCFPEFSSKELFGNNQPVSIEFCSGNGEWIIQKAQENPHINWIASEIKFLRVRKIWVKLKQLNLPNLIVAFGDARELVRYYLKENSIDQIFINFPDPWPKEKHAKNRLIQAPFTHQIKKILKEKKTITIVTDHDAYTHQIIDELGQVLDPVYPFPYYQLKTIEYGSSYFYRLFESKGKEIKMMEFSKHG